MNFIEHIGEQLRKGGDLQLPSALHLATVAKLFARN